MQTKSMIQQVIINYEFDTNLGLLLFDCISFVLAKTARELASILHRNSSEEWILYH